MGTYVSRNSSQTESDLLVVSSAATEGMADCKPRDNTRQHTSQMMMSQDDFWRYTTAFQVAHEFLDKSGSIIERQRMLESELATCHDRYDRAHH